MNGYEGMFVLDATAAAKEWSKLQASVLGIVTKHGGEIKSSARWGDRKLAYDIHGHKRGTYMLAYFTAPDGAIPKIRRECELSESIVRYIFIAREGTLPVAAPAQFVDEPRYDRDRGGRGGGGGGRFRDRN